MSTSMAYNNNTIFNMILNITININNINSYYLDYQLKTIVPRII